VQAFEPDPVYINPGPVVVSDHEGSIVSASPLRTTAHGVQLFRSHPGIHWLEFQTGIAASFLAGARRPRRYAQRVDETAVTQSEARLRGAVILVAEDHQDSRDGLRQLLEAFGAEVLVASDGEDALRILSAVLPDVILSDIRMPGMDGLQLAHRVKGDQRWARVPIIAVTAHIGPADLPALRQAGFAGHIQKPVDLDMLTTTIARALRAA
jgi:CheY-like chemotaxis protein